MGNVLHKIGNYFYHHPWRVVATWLIILAVLGSVAASQYKPPTSAVSIPGTPADTALTQMNKLFPDVGEGSARVVVQVPGESKEVSDYKTDIDQFTQRVEVVDGVKLAVSPFNNPRAISGDKTTAIIQLQLAGKNGEVADATTRSIESLMKDLRKTGLTVEAGGDIIQKAPSEILGIGELFGLLIAIAVLYVIYRSVRLAGLSIAIALLSVAVAMAGLFGLSQVITVSATTPVLAVMLGLAVGIDYSLFIVNKYQRLTRDGMSSAEAAGRANGTAGNAVLFAAATVVVALSSLAVVNIPFMTTMGLAGAATIALAGIVAVTLVPALLGIIARRMKTQSTTESHKSRHKVSYAWIDAITKRPIVAIIVGLILITAMAWPISSIQLGLPLDEYAAKTSTERKAYDIVADKFGAGYNSPIIVVADGLPEVSTEEQSVIKAKLMEQYNQQVATEEAKMRQSFEAEAAAITSQEQYEVLQQRIAQVQQEGEAKKAAALAQIDTGAVELSKRAHLQVIADNIKKQADVDDVVIGVANSKGSAGLIQVIPKTAPFDQATSQLIDNLRSKSTQEKLSSYNNVEYGVTGSTALQLDINRKLTEALPVYLAVVVGLSLVILVLAFRSILVPIKATLGFVLSVLAMFGALVVVFQWGWFGLAEAPGPIISFIPIIATGILFGLSMDYEFFLVSSMHEAHAQGMDARRAVVEGYSHSSRVVVAAASIMITVFGGFIFNHDATIQAIGFGLAVGIFVDAFIVRLLLVPATMWLMGDTAWWIPKWLDKRLPHISVEGEE